MSSDDNMVRIRITHPFPEIARVATIDVCFTREELLDESKAPERDRLVKTTISEAEKMIGDFDMAMSVVEPLVGVRSPAKITTTPAPAPEQASGDDEPCPTCNSKMVWITKTSKKTNRPWSAWSCPKTHPSIPAADRCSQKLVFPDNK